MGRRNKPWFRPDIGWWVTTIARKQFRLARGTSKYDKKSEAEAWQAFHELMALRPRRPHAWNGRVCDLIEEFLSSCATKNGTAPDTLRNYRFYLHSFAGKFGYLHPSEVRKFHVRKWVQEKPWNETSEYNARRTVFRVFSWGVQEGYLPENPVNGLKRDKPKTTRRCLSFEEWCKLLRGARRPLRVFLWCLMETGARPSELRGLTWEQVKKDRLILKDHKTSKKTDKPRVIHLSDRMQRRIWKLRKRSTSRYVFTNSRGQPWTENAIRMRISKIRKRTGLANDVCAYTIRHTYGTWAIMNGVDPATLAELMGHSSTEMIVKVYCHLAEQSSHMQAAANLAQQCPVRPNIRRNGQSPDKGKSV